ALYGTAGAHSDPERPPAQLPRLLRAPGGGWRLRRCACPATGRIPGGVRDRPRPRRPQPAERHRLHRQGIRRRTERQDAEDLRQVAFFLVITAAAVVSSTTTISALSLPS